jgi:hypothetical protein
VEKNNKHMHKHKNETRDYSGTSLRYVTRKCLNTKNAKSTRNNYMTRDNYRRYIRSQTRSSQCKI